MRGGGGGGTPRGKMVRGRKSGKTRGHRGKGGRQEKRNANHCKKSFWNDFNEDTRVLEGCAKDLCRCLRVERFRVKKTRAEDFSSTESDVAGMGAYVSPMLMAVLSCK